MMGTRFRIESKGIGTGSSGFLRLYSERLGAIPVPLPPRNEQDQLLAFIQLQDLKIRRFIRNKRSLIKLLNEQKQVIINQAVTRGLDPKISLKSSGVPYVEEIPDHWEILPIKRVLNRLIDTEHKTAPSVEDGRYLVVRTTNIKDGKLTLKGAYFTDEDGFREWTRRGIPEPGELFFTREAPAGEACIVPENVDLCMGQRVVLMGINPDKCLPKFALFNIYGGVTAEFIKIRSQGSTVPHFNMSDIATMPILIPSLSEQKEIIEAVEKEIVRIEAIQNKIQKEIDLIQEYRTRLISDAVTGRIDVRDIEIPALPDEDIVEELEDEELLEEAEAELEEDGNTDE
jgi:type I restriction enzyme S subunit